MTTKQAKQHWDTFSDEVEEHWDELLDFIEEKTPLTWISKNILRRLTVEAPVIIIFCGTCVLLHILQQTIFPGLNTFLAVHDTFNIFDPMQFPNLLTHVFVHDGTMNHIKGNLVHILLVGPSAEHVYGSQAMLIVILLVAVTSAFAHIIFGSVNHHQLGASGVVFCVILLNSLVAAVSGKIPLSFVITVCLWGVDEVYKFFFGNDHVSHHAHIAGAVVGTAYAFYRCNLDAQKKPTNTVWARLTKKLK